MLHMSYIYIYIVCVLPVRQRPWRHSFRRDEPGASRGQERWTRA